ncbi:hypothetical protein CH75_04695 [Dyella jiangningensis]|nr:hypothetical protein CH75_04695 [Dyella jiangningensis]
MTTEHVSVPHKVYENLAQIADGKMSYNDMQDLAAEAYNLLSRATPSDVYPNADTQAYIDELHVRIANLEKVVASRVVTSNDVNAASLAYNESIEQTHDGFDLPWCDEDAMRAALESFATSLPAARVPDAEVRLWDTQWMNIVNHDNCYRDWSKDDAIAHAVKMTEQAIARNIADGKLPPKKIDAAPQAGEIG